MYTNKAAGKTATNNTTVKYNYPCFCGQNFGVCDFKNEVAMKRDEDGGAKIRLTTHLEDNTKSVRYIELSFMELDGVWKILKHPSLHR